MENIHNISNNAQSIKTQTPTFAVLNEDELSALQTERFLYASMMYGDEISLRIISATTIHGISSWENTSCKITAISENNGLSDEYASCIESSIKIDHMYTDRDIIKIISKIRKDLGLPPYLRQIIKNCLRDFLAYHVAIENKGEEDPKTGKSVVLGYTPVVNLKLQF